MPPLTWKPQLSPTPTFQCCHCLKNSEWLLPLKIPILNCLCTYLSHMNIPATVALSQSQSSTTHKFLVSQLPHHFQLTLATGTSMYWHFSGFFVIWNLLTFWKVPFKFPTYPLHQVFQLLIAPCNPDFILSWKNPIVINPSHTCPHCH